MQRQKIVPAVADQRSARPGSPREAGPSTLLLSLAALPFIGFLVGVTFVNRVTPFIFGFPCLLAWVLLWIVLTSIVMGAIYRLDPDNAIKEEVEQ